MKKRSNPYRMNEEAKQIWNATYAASYAGYWQAMLGQPSRLKSAQEACERAIYTANHAVRSLELWRFAEDPEAGTVLDADDTDSAGGPY